MQPNDQMNQMNNAPLGANNPSSMPVESKKKVGPIVVILAVVLILIIGALYLFASSTNKNAVPTDEDIAAETVKPVTNTSDDVQDLNADLNSAIEGIDQQSF